MSTWHYTDLILKMNIIGIGVFLTIVLGTRGLYYFLVEIRPFLDPFNAWEVLLIWYVLGIALFLCPPVPGPPMYIFGGLVCVGKFEDDASMIWATRDNAFIGGIAFMVLNCLVLKLIACYCQQKWFGEYIGASSPMILQQVGVNKPFIRAIEVVIRQPGMSGGKCAILCGGPDWPTSVLCGLLKLNVWKIMYGTLPIVVFIFPMVCTGAFMLKDSPLFETLSMIFGVLSGLMTVILGYWATCY